MAEELYSSASFPSYGTFEVTLDFCPFINQLQVALGGGRGVVAGIQ